MTLFLYINMTYFNDVKKNCFSTHNTSNIKYVGFFSTPTNFSTLWTPNGCFTVHL